MDWELYEKILGDAVEFGITKIQLHFQGEPLLYKKFPDMVKAAKAAGLFTQAFTNGLPLTRERTSRIIQAGLDSLRFSVDGATQSTYEKNRVGGIWKSQKKDHGSREKQRKKRVLLLPGPEFTLLAANKWFLFEER